MYERAANLSKGPAYSRPRCRRPFRPPRRHDAIRTSKDLYRPAISYQETKNGVVLVDFWAELCGPAGRLAATLASPGG